MPDSIPNVGLVLGPAPYYVLPFSARSSPDGLVAAFGLRRLCGMDDASRGDSPCRPRSVRSFKSFLHSGRALAALHPQKQLHFLGVVEHEHGGTCLRVRLQLYESKV